jgi:hypothetical protein
MPLITAPIAITDLKNHIGIITDAFPHPATWFGTAVNEFSVCAVGNLNCVRFIAFDCDEGSPGPVFNKRNNLFL